MTTHILGDNVPRKSNYDPDLARKVAKYYEEHPEELNDKPKLEDSPSPTVTSIDDFIVLKDIRCVGADGNVFEQYDELHIAKDVVRQADGTHQSFTPYQAIVYFEQKGLFLPSMALSCNIVAALFQAAVEKKGTEYAVKDAELKKVLDQYKDHGAGYGWQAQNTLIDWNRRKILHYPRDADFPQDGGRNNINLSRSSIGLSIPMGIGEMHLVDALKNAEATKYVRNLTGLKDPAVLVQVGEYFRETARILTSFGLETRAARLGCNGVGFCLNASNFLYSTGAVRGVRFKSAKHACAVNGVPSRNRCFGM